MASDKLKILAVDDSEDDLFILSRYISKIDTFDISLDTEINYNTARQKILRNEHDLYIVDHLLGPETGLDLIRECTAENIKKPFILLAGKGNKAVDIEATKAGVYDYLTKGELNVELLERSLRYSLQHYYAFMAIAESEQRYKEIFNKSVDIIFVLDENFRLVDFNPMMGTLMGFTVEELAGRPFADLFASEEQAGMFLALIKSTEVKDEQEITLLTKSHTEKTFLASISKISGLSGKLQYQGILHDYTSIKKTLAEKLWTAKMEAKDNLVKSLAHEIRNPLTNINLSIGQLEGELKAEDKVVFMDIAKRNSQRINDLITELMSQSGQVVYKDAYIDINQILKLALSDAMDRIKFKKIEVSEKYIPEGIVIMGDKMKMQIAFLNIIINALEAMENSTGKLEIETKTANNIATIRISDNGKGMSADNLKNLFSPYYTKKKNGLGLGLTNTRSIIEAHNGKIEVNSVEGEGTTFRIKVKLS